MSSAGAGVGIDIERADAINITNANFVQRNFTHAEIDYCHSSSSPQESFTGRWCAKEAVLKAITDAQSSDERDAPLWKSAGDSLDQIEILPSVSGAPYVKLHGMAASVAEQVGVRELKVKKLHP